MDPFSSEGELLNIHNAFHQGQFDAVISSDTSSLSTPENKLSARVFTLRARIAIGEAEDVLAELDSEVGDDDENLDLQAVKALAGYVVGGEYRETAVQVVEALVAGKKGEANPTVQILGATVLMREGRLDEALKVLSKHVGILEAVALTVQIRLSQNRTDLALREVQAAKRWSQDNLLVNLAESWVGLRVGGEKYQQAYYVYEELAQASATSSSRSLVGQAVAELHLGRLEEAEVALRQALTKDSKHPEALVNMVVCLVLAGKDFTQCINSLQDAFPEHPFIIEVQEKGDIFDKAASKYATKAAA